MSLLAKCKAKLKTFQRGSVEHQILDYLLTNAVGHRNAKSWKKISNNLTINTAQQTFQHGLLKSSREGGYFIGSCNKGYYIIHDEHDVAVSKAYYENRIAAEQTHLNNLNELYPVL